MKITKTNLQDCVIIENPVHKDDRGLFIETYQKKKSIISDQGIYAANGAGRASQE